MATWQISGEYMETCNCTFLCPCISSNLSDAPTEGNCKAALGMRIDKGAKDGVSLDGVSFVVMLYSPGVMGAGNFTVGLIVDEKASSAQTDAIAAIVSGSAGGPMAALAPLVGQFAGIERRAIQFEADGLRRTVRAGDLLDQTCEGVPSVSAPGEPIMLDNVAHPVTTRLGLAKATHSAFDAFGIQWKDSSGNRNGHLAPFNWAG